MRILLFILGTISTSLAVLGIILPVLPTTPLLLLALFCFSKSSKKFETWLINSDLYKNYLEEFVTERSMPLKRKVILVSFATTMMMFPLFILDYLFIKTIILLLLFYLYYYFIFKIKTT